MNAPALTAIGVTKRFGRDVVLDGLDLEIRRGETFVLLGANGAGKTTFLRAAFGLLRLDSGSICVAGYDGARRPVELRRAVAYVPDAPEVPSWMTVADLFAFLAPFHPSWDPAEAERLATAFDLPRKTPFGRLSRGQATKSLLAAALAPRPSVLLMDEPFGGLDPTARDDVTRGVIGAFKAEERTVILTTHDLDVAARVADRIGRLKDGRIRRIASTEDLLDPVDDDGGVRGAGRAPRSAVEALRAAFEFGSAGGAS